MELASIRAHALSSPIDPPQERAYAGGVRRIHKRDAVLVIVETPDGTVGYAPAGASSSAMREHFADASQARFADLLSGRIAAVLEGRSIEDPAELRPLIASLDLPPVISWQATAALDVACYDLLGKRRGAPIAELLGPGEPDTWLECYASAGMYMEPTGYAAQAGILRDLGFAGYKFRPGIGPEGDREAVSRVLDAAGEMPVMIDAHTWWKAEGYDDATVRDLVTAWADAAYWIEEPVPPDDYDGYRELATTGAVLAGGESEPSPAGLLDLAGTGAIRFLQGDVRHHGGFTGVLEAVEYCNWRDSIRFVPHHFGTLLGLVANAHLVAGAVDGTLIEYPVFENDPHLDADADPGMYPFSLAFDVLKDDLTLRDGRLRVPAGPGLGVDVDESVIEDYPFVEGAWSTFHPT